MDDFDVSVEHLDEAVLLRPVGALDLATAPEMERILRGVLPQHPTVVLDLSGVTFADCAGLRPIRRAVNEAAPHRTSVRMFAARPAVERVMRLTGLDVREAPTLPKRDASPA